jgi:hypothetical protein
MHGCYIYTVVLKTNSNTPTEGLIWFHTTSLNRMFPYFAIVLHVPTNGVLPYLPTDATYTNSLYLYVYMVGI